jgi:glycosyltransferase involved in cell wall biosynthesis
MSKLSIITINLNNREGLERTIQSVINQTFTDFEYIIIDGGSTDGSVEVIQNHADRIDYWVSEPDKGIYNAMNKGILKANGEYLQFLNSGDWLYSDTILEEVFALNRTEDILYGDDALFYNDQNIAFKTYPSTLTGYLFYVGTISHQATFHKATLFDKRYNENYKIAADWELQIQKIIFQNCSTYHIEKPIIYFDMTGISQNPLFANLLMEERQSILKKYFPEMVLADYAELRDLKAIANYALYPYVELFSRFPKLQRIVKRFMKMILILSGKKHLIPR